MNLKNNIITITQLLPPQVTLVAVSKTYPVETIQEAYDAGLRHFGENKVQELQTKHQNLPNDIHWHMIGHLQSNKVKFIAPFIYLIHSIDSLNLLLEINKQAKKANRILNGLLQIHIAKEDTKYGFDIPEVTNLLQSPVWTELQHVRIQGLMGMASLTDNADLVHQEFQQLHQIYTRLSSGPLPTQVEMNTLSMGMSSDYTIAIKEGSTMVRIGSAIFGSRH